MSMKNWREAVLPPDASLREALKTLDRTAVQIVLVVLRDGRLAGTLTDGDIRRHVLRGGDLDDVVGSCMNARPVTIPEGASEVEALDLLRRMAIHSVPVLDATGLVRGLFTLDDLIQPPDIEVPAVIMAGGRGERLRPLTDEIPKPLVVVGGQPLIDVLVRRLVMQGFRRVWVAVGYRASDIENHLGDGGHLGAQVRYLRETAPLGTAGAVRNVPVDDPGAPILVCNADTLHGADFNAVLETHVRSGAIATMAVVEHASEVPFGVAFVQDGMLKDLVEKPVRRDLVAAGINVVTGHALSLLQADKLDMTDVFRAALDQGLPAAVHRIDGYWIDVGTPGTLHKARLDHGNEG